VSGGIFETPLGADTNGVLMLSSVLAAILLMAIHILILGSKGVKMSAKSPARTQPGTAYR